MSALITTTASAVNGILSFINPTQTERIAYDNDELAIPLIEKLQESVGNLDGSKSVSLSFFDNEEELLKQFSGVCKEIEDVYAFLSFVSSV